MLQHRINSKQAPLRIFKNYKYTYKSLLTKNYFLQQDFILFYYYDIMSINRQNIIQKILLDNDLKYYKLTKKILINFIKENNLNYFKNIIQNNILIIYNFKNLNFNYTIFIKNLSFKELHFIGIWLNKQFLRPWELKKNFTSLNNNYKKKIIQLLKYKVLYNFYCIIKVKI